MESMISQDITSHEVMDDYINPLFADPLRKLGFKLEAVGSLTTKDLGTQTHVLIFEQQGELTDNVLEKIKEICTIDDDSQPHATYRMYFGTLFVFIPAFS